MSVSSDAQMFLRVGNDKALSRVVSRIRQACPLELGDATAERYWKDPGLRDVRFSVAVSPGSTGDMVYQVLRAAWSLGEPWGVSSIGQPGTPGWEFVAIADRGSARIGVPGLEWARFSLRG
ncbi:hypothetical protein O3Q52_12920 [Streptomyces sp. ActVer]|uniref:hypothetical protein n=1 Tax=Streptomyces sp. ActVer TaxID=3014558 RepID=UPI0022B494FE|nr:hypothetical protein [Streptomyces sp. ActVer]MCZ4509091.1 hypothetical protein [Streptomyces sp. ActVer]